MFPLPKGAFNTAKKGSGTVQYTTKYAIHVKLSLKLVDYFLLVKVAELLKISYSTKLN